MSMSVHLVVQQVNRGAAYLWNPPCDSWVSSFASLFFLLAVLVASPMLFLLALDFTSYAIVRTLGIPYAHPTSSKPSTLPSSPVTPAAITTTILPSPSSLSLNSSSPISMKKPKTKKKPSQISITLGPLEVPSQPQEYFTTPGERNLALAGVGVFSPPQSRTPSPPVTRRNTATDILGTGLQGVASLHGLLGVGTDRGDKSTEVDRERVPVNGQGNDSSDDDVDTLSTLRRRKTTGLVTPPDS